MFFVGGIWEAGVRRNGGGVTWKSIPTEERRGGVSERLGDFATICLQLSGSVLCSRQDRTGGWWPPYFC